MKTETIKQIEKHLKKSREKHTSFNEGVLYTAYITAKEISEDYIHANILKSEKCMKRAKDEALDLIAVLIRFIEND